MDKLLKTYEETDQAVQDSLEQADRETACKKGCCTCCQHIGFPILEPEVKNIAQHMKENVETEIGGRMLRQMEQYDPEKPCPFLVDTECGIYAIRPLACRTFYVHGEPCTEEEVTKFSRVPDIHRPDPNAIMEASRPLLELYGIEDPQKQFMAFHSGLIQHVSFSMSDVAWSELASIIKSEK